MTHSILITGASNGIGAALARHYSAPNVVLGLIGRNRQRLEQVAASCEAQGATICIGQLDITDTPALQHWIQDFDTRHPVDLLIANAGITGQTSPQGGNEGESMEQIEQLFAINQLGVIHTVHALLERMRQRGHGQIALVSSLGAYRGMPVTPAYCASKAAVKSYGEALRGWLASEGIQINIICPGFVKTDLSDEFPGNRPFMISSTQAATLIAKGLACNQAIISFPFPLNLGMWFVGALPFPLASFFLGLFGYNRAKHHAKPNRS